MDTPTILQYLSKGRTDYFLELLKKENFQELLEVGPVKPLRWLIYYDDLTALKLLLEKGGTLDSIDLNQELNSAAFFGHWKICEFLINQGADVNAKLESTHETALHSALCKAGRPYYFYTIKVLVDKGADVNAATLPNQETDAFMRDVRTKGETPLHRAAAYADEQIISYLIEHGAKLDAKDALGNSPISWASEHLRPGTLLALLSYGNHRVGEGHKVKNISDHGQKWGNSMDWNLYGEYLLEDNNQ